MGEDREDETRSVGVSPTRRGTEGNRFLGIAEEKTCDAETKKPLGKLRAELLKGGENSGKVRKPASMTGFRRR